MLDQLTTLFLLAEVSHQIIAKLYYLFLFLFIFLAFLVINYRPIVEELADIILSADVETVEAIQHRYGEQV
jgi:hypothetical protein